MLIICRECNREISSMAGACPGCGAPVGPAMSIRTPVQTIEKTSKNLKAAVVLFGCLAAFSCVGIVGSAKEDPAMARVFAYLFWFALAGYGFTKFRIYWHHH